MSEREESLQEEEPLEIGEMSAQTQVETDFGYYDLDEYAGEIETHWWVPDKSNPKKKIRLDLKTQALTGSQINIIHKNALRAQNAAVEATYLQQRITQHTMPREIYRLREKMGEISDLDFDTPEEAEKKRDELDKKIQKLLADWKTEHDKMNADLDILLKHDSFYETLRREFFSVVIFDHSIAMRGSKIDFTEPMTDSEPPDKFITTLKDYLDEVLRRGKAARQNGKRR